MTKKNVLFVPGFRENPYLDLLSSAIEERGYNIKFTHFVKSWFPLWKTIRQYPQADIVNIHWLHPALGRFVWTRNKLKRRIKLAIWALDIFLCRLSGVKLVWTIHNLVGHESDGPEMEIMVRRALARKVDAIILHSHGALKLVSDVYGLSLKDKAHIVPHAAYSGHYPLRSDRTEALKQQFGIEEGDFVYLLMGSIRGYKGVERLVEAFEAGAPDKSKLLIAGKVYDQNLEIWLKRKAQISRSIIVYPNFVPNEDVAAYIECCDVAVLPYTQTLSSGILMLMLTFGKPLIMSETCRVYDYPGDEGAVYFDGEQDLPRALQLIQHSDLKAMAAHNKKLAEGLTWARMGTQVAAIYDRVLGCS